MKKVCVLSLRCAVGLQKEVDTICTGFRRNNWTAFQLLAADYRRLRGEDDHVIFMPLRRGYLGMLGDIISEITTGRIASRLRDMHPDLILFYNLSPLNLIILRQLQDSGCSCGVFLHDPQKKRKFTHGLAFGLIYYIVEILQRWLVCHCEHVITLSNHGTELVRRAYPNLPGMLTEARILLPEKSAVVTPKRRVVSIIGRINPATGHDEFIELAGKMRAYLTDVEFEVVTSSPSALSQAFASQAKVNNVAIIFKAVLTESEIECAIARSICVFRMDMELTQSGVVPLCYRQGTPVIARAIEGLAQHVDEGRTGYLIKPGARAEQLASYIKEFQSDQERYSKNCILAFRQSWSAAEFDRYYASLMMSVTCDSRKVWDSSQEGV